MISKIQTNIFKGISIIMIVLHNYLHLLPPKLGENEMTFKNGLFNQYIEYLSHNPNEFMAVFFSYFGHYGVPVFIILSVYGMTISSLKKNESYAFFVHYRLSKIYLPFVIVVVLYLLLGYAKSIIQQTPDLLWHQHPADELLSVFYKLLLISNFIPGQALLPVGPWWFLSFIVQLYVIFPFILKFYNRFGNLFLIVLAVIGIFLQTYAWSQFFEVNIKFTALGHLPSISLGMYLSKQSHISAKVFIASVIVFIAGNFFYPAWILSDITFSIIFFYVFLKVFSGRIPLSRFEKIIEFIGKFSLYIFLLNGFIRLLVYSISNELNSLGILINDSIYAFFCLAICLALACAMTITENYLRRRKSLN